MTTLQRSSKLGWGEAIGLLLLVGAVGLMVWPAFQSSETEMLVPLGTPLPPWMVEGWVNAERAPSLSGKVVVVDCWATWCVPCRAAMPRLAKLYTQYQPLGVEFVGITPEGAAALPAIEKFLAEVGGVTWPIGFGANPTLDMLGVGAFPTLIVFNNQGRAVWSGWDVDALPNVLDQTVALRE